MRTIGLTGGIGSGKSSVARWFKGLGIPVLDADAVVHNLLKEDVGILAQLKDEFGLDILGMDGKIDRQALGQKVFGDKPARVRLEEILHPQVRAELRTESSRLLQEGIWLCVWDVPLLLESGFDVEVDEIWVVWVPRHTQIQRVRQRDKLSDAQILARINAQMGLDQKREYADVLIDNSGSWADTAKQLGQEWERLKVDIK